MKAKQYFMVLVAAMCVIYGVHFLLLHNRVISYSWYHFNIFDGVIFALFILGGFMLRPAFNEPGEKYVMRFMVLTTFQLLSVLAILTAVIYTKIPQSRLVAFNVIGVFLSMLVVQSVLLVRGLRNK